MSHFKNISLDQILFENVSVILNGFDPILQSVDLELPMDQTVIVQSSNPTHAVYLLEILAGRKMPQSGRIFWNENLISDQDENEWSRHDLVGCYFENQRPHPEQNIQKIFEFSTSSQDNISDVAEHFELQDELQTSFKNLTYEKQKLVLLISATLKNPQMLILEDPAVGLSEKAFLEFLDWVQLGQRQGCMRHIFMTNNHPVASRHLESAILYLEEGLVYFEENQKIKKAVHF
jgi:ABC-type multidrug transport system ATPase subunit